MYVVSHADTHHQDYILVRGNASPYDGNLLYWAKRLKQHPLVNNEKAKLLQIQKGQCPRCGLYFRGGDLLEVDHRVPIALGGKDTIAVAGKIEPVVPGFRPWKSRSIFSAKCFQRTVAGEVSPFVA